MHRILPEEGAKPTREAQRRLNPPMMEVVKKEIIKLLDCRVIYPISDSRWVSPVQVVPKKSVVTVVKNEENELVPTRIQTGWRVCIDYRKLNATTRKDHFPLPFIDQMLERLAGHSFYCFLDGYSGYNQIVIAPDDQEKTTFTCPFGTFAYRRMPVGLCNAPATFQRCMGIEVDKSKIGLVCHLPSPTSVREVRSFLGHARFYRRFIKDFSKISTPLCRLLQKDVPFVFDDECEKAFNHLKELLTSAPIIVPPDWSLLFELMCDASDYALGAVLGQRKDKKPQVIYYASRTLNDAQLNYSTTEKELLVVFDVEIRDKRGCENVVADHLSRLVHEEDLLPIPEAFPDEQLLTIEGNQVNCARHPPGVDHEQGSARIPKWNLGRVLSTWYQSIRGTRQSSRVRGQDPLPEQEEIPIPTPVPESVEQYFVGGPSGAAPTVPTMPLDPNFQQTLELLTQALSRIEQTRDPSLGYADQAKRIGAQILMVMVIQQWLRNG
ncbi:unnamed protein product [Prunus armeniaca]